MALIRLNNSACTYIFLLHKSIGICFKTILSTKQYEVHLSTCDYARCQTAQILAFKCTHEYIHEYLGDDKLKIPLKKIPTTLLNFFFFAFSLLLFSHIFQRQQFYLHSSFLGANIYLHIIACVSVGGWVGCVSVGGWKASYACVFMDFRPRFWQSRPPTDRKTG